VPAILSESGTVSSSEWAYISLDANAIIL
jgi:hypothetical protein